MAEEDNTDSEDQYGERVDNPTAPPEDAATPEDLRTATAMDVADYQNRTTPDTGGVAWRFAHSTPDQLRARMNVPDTIGNVIEARRAALAQGVSSGVDPDRPAIYMGPHEQAQLEKKYALASRAANDYALTQAHVSHQNFINQKNVEVAKQSQNIFDELATLQPDGSPETEQRVLDIVGRNRTAFDMSPTVRYEVGRFSKAHDLAAKNDLGSGYTFYPDVETARAALGPNTTLEQDPKGRGYRAVRIGVDKTATGPIDPTEKSRINKVAKNNEDLTPQTWHTVTGAVGGTFDKDTKKFTQNDTGQDVELNTPTGKYHMTKQDLELFKKHWGVPAASGATQPPPANQNTTAGATASPTPASGPAIGAERVIKGQPAVWDGQGWKPK